MSSERFYLTGAGQRERYRRKYIRQLAKEDRLEEVYSSGVLLEIDFAAKRIVRRLDMAADEIDYRVDGYATNFTVPHREGGRLIVPSHAVLFDIDLDSFEVQGQLTHRLMNDVHHVTRREGRWYIVSTGLDRVVVLDGAEDSEPEIHAAIPDARPLDPTIDYRTVNTKPHLSHPNFVIFHDGEIWVSRAKQHDCVKLDDLETTIPLADVMIHDGLLRGGSHFFTSVKGEVIEVDLVGRRVLRRTNLLEQRWHLLAGWCRGLHVTDDYFYVAFSVFRRTKLVENIQWVKSRMEGSAPPMPTRIEKIDRRTGEVADAMEFGPEELSAIFWLAPAG